MAKDLYKAGSLIGQGRFRELHDKAAVRISDNLIAMGIIEKPVQQRVEEANKKIEGHQVIHDSDNKAYATSRLLGDYVRTFKCSIGALRGTNKITPAHNRPVTTNTPAVQRVSKDIEDR